jgi:formate hydrogenlyase subunit 6/NADH:ubiquinone oxidoreductase subunit I
MSATIAVKECDALACGFLCLHACPLGVLLAVPRNHSRGGSAKPRGYAVAPRFDGHCNACGLCIEACPQSAISIQG